MPAPAAAQTNSFINAGVQFEFPPPGARSLALGGAFVAVADDATASVANPAGLALLVRPEVSVEGRFWNFSTLAPLRGRYSGTPTGVGYDTIQNIVEDKLDETSIDMALVFRRARHQLLPCPPLTGDADRSLDWQTSRIACSSAESCTGLVKHLTPVLRRMSEES